MEKPMITIEQKNSLVNIAVLGEFTLADYQEFEQAVLHGIKSRGKVNVLFDLRDMLGFTLDVAWEEIKFNREHRHDFGKIAVVTGNQWVSWSAWLPELFVDAEIQLFDNYELARDWVAAE